jgi:hypothetical protein
MAKLTIGNQTVTVGDEFLRMSPEQQQATVDEIAASLGAAPQQDDALAAASSMSRFGPGTDTAAPALPAQQPARPDILGSTAATLGGLVNGIPVVGPLAQNLSDSIAGTGAMLTGGNFDETVQGIRRRRQELAAANPIASVSGNIGGALGAFGVGGLSTTGANALGLTGNLLPRIAATPVTGSVANATAGFQGGQLLNSGLSTLGLTTADNMVRGAKPTDALAEAVGPSLISAAIPLGGELIKRGSGAVYDNVIRPVQTAFNRENEVTRRIGLALQQGENGPARLGMTQADEAVAAQAGTPVINADRGGAPLRTLARTAANVSPEAAQSLNATVSDRFETQGPRAVSFIQRLMNGATDDLALQDALRQGARKANQPAYRAAYDAPQAKAIWTPEIRNLMQADPFRQAINAAEQTSTNAAAVSGGNAIRNPFVFRPDGTVTLRQLPDGSYALPNLEFWDIVQRNLRNSSELAQRNGDNLLAGQIGDMRRQLNSVLDNAVPEFNQARRGAAQFFGAEDAIDAGKQFATSPRAIPEARKAFGQFTQAERDAFSIGYASELIDTIKASRDRVNVINQVFGSQARREMNELALGAHKARELEAFVRVEAIVDQLRSAVSGNSSTAQQLISAGVVGGAGGYFASGGDWTQAASMAGLVAAGRRGLQVLGKKVDERVMARIGEVLASGDPSALQRAIQNAALSAEHRTALEAIQIGLQGAARGAVMGGAAGMQPEPTQPLRVTVNGAGSYSGT